MNERARFRPQIVASKVFPCIERNQRELNLDINKLYNTPCAHVRVYVKCEKCGEEFLREWRHLHRPHACPISKYIDGVLHKWCCLCSRFVSKNSFHHSVKHSSTGLASYCIDCEKSKYGMRRRNKAKQTRNTIDGWIRGIFRNKRSESKKRDIKFNLTAEFLIELWHKQNGKCYYSNISMDVNKRDPASASLDRLDSTLGYTTDNVVWACKALNFGKNNTQHNRFVEFLNGIEVPAWALPRCECKLIDNSAKLPTRSKGHDAGLDISSSIDITIHPGSTVEVSTGVIISAPSGYYFTIEGRSGLFRKGVFPLRGVIDATYVGETNIALFNASKEVYEVKCGDRIAQLLLHKIYHPDIVMVDKFTDVDGGRGAAGYGSTGK